MKGQGGPANNASKSLYKDKEKPTQIRYSNITAAKGLFTLVTVIILLYNLRIIFNRITLHTC